MYVYTNAVCLLSLTRPIRYENEHWTDDDESDMPELAGVSSGDDRPGPQNNASESEDSSDSDLSTDDTVHTEYARMGVYRVDMRSYASTLDAFEHYLRLVLVFFYPFVCIMLVCVFSCCVSLLYVCYFQAERVWPNDVGYRAAYGFVQVAKAFISGPRQLPDACRSPLDW